LLGRWRTSANHCANYLLKTLLFVSKNGLESLTKKSEREVQGAHGFLIDEFLWPVSNTRSDAFGGSLAARVRFAAEITGAIRRDVGPSFPIALRLSQHKLQDQNAKIVRDAKDIEQLTAPLVDAGLNLFDIATRSVSQPAFAVSPLTLGGWFRKLSGRPVVANGSVGLDKPGQRDAELAPLDVVDVLLVRDEVDLIAVGRGLLADAGVGQQGARGAARRTATI
jgi:2,4-dienoyl-CoA reductase-like NADH-dependent reductase (Old Yellow Enzyme family)